MPLPLHSSVHISGPFHVVPSSRLSTQVHEVFRGDKRDAVRFDGANATSFPQTGEALVRAAALLDSVYVAAGMHPRASMASSTATPAMKKPSA